MERKFIKKSEEIYPKSDPYSSPSGQPVSTEAYQKGIESARRDFEEISGDPSRIQLTINHVQHRLSQYDQDDNNLFQADRFHKYLDQGYLEEMTNLSSGANGAKMSNRFFKKSAPFGGPPPEEDPNSQGGGPISPSKPPVAPGPSGTPPKPEEALTEEPGGLSEEPGGLERTPPTGPSQDVPTDVNLDAATGEITITKGPINFKIAKYDPDSPPDQVSHLPKNSQRQWVHIVNKSLDAGDDEETAFKKAWGAIPDEGKKTKDSKVAAPLDSNAADYIASPTEIDPGMSGMEPDHESALLSGAFKPGESVKTRDPETGQEQYGFIVQLNENGLYTINYEDGSTRDLHEGWIMDAPEAANAEQGQQELFGDDFNRMASFEKTAVHNDWIDFNKGNVPGYGDEETYSKEYHNNPFSHPNNRLEAPKFTVTATVPDGVNARGVAFALQTQAFVEVDVSGQNLTIKNVENPLGLITELNEYGLEDAKTQGESLVNKDQGFGDLKEGMKVAIVGDYPEMNYYYNSFVPPAQAYIVAKTGSKFILENERWGRFEADEWEIANV